MIHGFLRRLYRLPDDAKDVYSFVRNDVEGARKYGTPLGTRIRAWRHGFASNHWEWLNLDENDSSSYITTIHAIRVIPNINGVYSGVFDDQVAFRNASQVYEKHLPPLYGTIHDGTYYSNGINGSKGNVVHAVENHETVILKPICGSGGNGVHRISYDESTYRLNGETVDTRRISELVSGLDEYLVTGFVTQHKYADAVFPDSTNSIRINTILDPDTRVPHVVRATHRFGTSQSVPTDNWSRGGLCAPVDVNSGQLQPAVSQYDDSSARIERIDSHPETNARIRGVVVPQWDEVCDVIERFAAHHNRAPYVGWDVVVTENGPIVIEANANPGVNLPQMERGLLEDDVAKRFFEQLEH